MTEKVLAVETWMIHFNLDKGKETLWNSVNQGFRVCGYIHLQPSTSSNVFSACAFLLKYSNIDGCCVGQVKGHANS